MDIGYPTQSKFLEACEAAIHGQHAKLQAGGVVRIDLDEGGYGGCVIVPIHVADRSVFGTDWTGADPTRFPTRIRAAAAALLNCHCEGAV